MPYTRRQLINQVLRLLDLTAGSHAGELNASDNNPANQVLTTDQTITDFLNDTGADMARTCLPIWDTGTKASVANGFVAFNSLTVASGNTIWVPEGAGVTFAGFPLTRGSKHFTDGNAASGTSANPFRYWWPNGQQGLTIVTNPVLTGTLSVFGLAIPKLLSVDTDTASWLPFSDHAVVLVEGAAARLCEKNAANSILGGQIAYHWERYAAGKQRMQGQLSDNEKALMAAFGDGV